MPVPAPATLWTSLGGLDAFLDFSSLFGLARNFLGGKVIHGFMNGKLGPQDWIYTVDLVAMIMSLAAAAFVVVKAVDSGVSFTNGFYATYGNDSTFSNYLYLYEVLVILTWDLWAFVIIILSITFASQIWEKVTLRVAEAKASSVGLDTPVSWMHAIKTTALLFVQTFGVVLTGYSLAYTSDPLIGYFDKYDDDTNNEATKKEDGSQVSTDGTSARNDIGISHMITTFYGFAVFVAISVGGMIFFNQFDPLEDNIQCDMELPDGAFDGVKAILANITDYDSCRANMDNLFKKLDLNQSGIYDRCEDALFQKFMGATDEYAIKYSAAFDIYAARAICDEFNN